MALFLASLAMGLGAVIVFYIIMWQRAPVWPPPGTPSLPRGLWLSTALLLAASGTLHAALRSVRRNQRFALRTWLAFTLVLAIGFLVSQIASWGVAVAAHMPPGLNMFAITFYLLTGLHGLHIIGGLVPLLIVNVRASRGRYSPTDHAGLTYCALYWHFLDIVWLVMFGLLVATS